VHFLHHDRAMLNSLTMGAWLAEGVGRQKRL
jgi:hypothetical protein